MHKTWRCDLPVSQQRAFAYHDSGYALQRLLPPWQSIEIVEPSASLEPGEKVVFRLGLGPLSVRYVARHTAYDPPHLFVDVQETGPFGHWEHRHRFEPGEATERSILIDEVDFAPPAGRAGRRLTGSMIERQLEAMFAFRHRRTFNDLSTFNAYPQLAGLRVAISGTSGLVGDEVGSLIGAAGGKLQRIVRNPSDRPDEVAIWSDRDEATKLDGVAGVIHLAGFPIAAKRWSSEVKQKIRESRVEKTRILSQRLAELQRPPKVFVCASATGFYGDRGDEELDEDSPQGTGFLPDVCGEWEAACQPARDAGIRVVHARFGLILSPRGGALSKLLLPTKLGGGGRAGSGQQWWSWISLDDAGRALVHALCDERVRGPVNIVTPQPQRNVDFTRTLASVLSRPAVVPAPAKLLRTALGEMADGLLLASARVDPKVLCETDFRFLFPGLEGALRHLLGKTTSHHYPHADEG